MNEIFSKNKNGILNFKWIKEKMKLSWSLNYIRAFQRVWFPNADSLIKEHSQRRESTREQLTNMTHIFYLVLHLDSTKKHFLLRDSHKKKINLSKNIAYAFWTNIAGKMPKFIWEKWNTALKWFVPNFPLTLSLYLSQLELLVIELRTWYLTFTISILSPSKSVSPIPPN